MVPFRICVLVSTSAEQFSNKTAFIKTVLETSTNLQSMFFYSAQGKGGGGYAFHRFTLDSVKT